MGDKKYIRHKIAGSIREIDFATNNIAVLEVKGKNICLGKFNGNLFAFAYKCPHAGGILADGFIDSLGNVVCPVHRYKYSLQNGRNTTGEGYYLKHWPVENEKDGVYIAMEESGGFFDWLK